MLTITTERRDAVVRDAAMLAVVDAAVTNLGRGGVDDTWVPPVVRPRRRVTNVLEALAVVIALLACLFVATRAAVATSPRCQAIQWALVPSGAPDGGLDDITIAMREITARSGIRFAEVGLEDAPAVTIGWVDPAGPVEWSGYTRVQWTGDDGNKVVRHGAITLDIGANVPTGFATSRSWGGVLLHELGHLVGLSHSTDPADVMFPTSMARPLKWSPTDLNALRSAGRDAGCEVGDN